MNRISVLAQASTQELINLFDQVEGMQLHALALGDRAENLRLRASHRGTSDAFEEELQAIQHELLARCATNDVHAQRFVENVSALHTYRTAS